LAANVTETKFVCPTGADRLAFDEFGRGLAQNAESVFYVDPAGVCHVVGPRDGVSSLGREILDAWTEDQSAIAGLDAWTEDQSAVAGLDAWTEDQSAVAGQAAAASRTSGYRTTTDGGLNVEVYTGNLLHDHVDAVVNPANVYLSHAGGAARAIADAAGHRLQSECRDYVQRYGNLRYTQVMHTSAGDMYPPVRYVIHAAGPPADQYRGNVAALRQAVFDTFYNCLRYANEQLRVRSVSIPAISSGAQCCLLYKNCALCRDGFKLK